MKRLLGDVSRGLRLVAVNEAGSLDLSLSVVGIRSEPWIVFFTCWGFCLVEKLATILTCGCRARWFVEAHLWVPVFVLWGVGPPLGLCFKIKL